MEQMIKDWATVMVNHFSWLTIKFEFSEKYRTFLVDFVYSSEYDDCDEFNVQAMSFNDKLIDLYHDDAPLFTDNGELFTLSAAATVIAKNIETFTGSKVDTAFCILSQFQPNWLEGVSYNQAETLETEATVNNYSEAIYQQAA